MRPPPIETADVTNASDVLAVTSPVNIMSIPDDSVRLLPNNDSIIDIIPEVHYDRIVELALAYFGAPIAFVSLADAGRHWFTANVGLTSTEIPEDWTFCEYTVRLASDSVLVVEDTLKDLRFCNIPLVLGEPFVRFYAGAGLISKDGHYLGVLAIIDTKPRHNLSGPDLKFLRLLANMVVDEIELSEERGNLAKQERLLQHAELMSGVGHWRVDLKTQTV